MAKLVIKNINTKLDGYIDRYVYDQIYERLSFAVQGAEFSDKVIDGSWDGYVRLFHRNQKTFPTGLIGRVLDIFEQTNTMYEIQDLRERPKPVKKIGLRKNFRGKPLEVRPYQLVALQKALLYGRGTLEAATGAGKSFIITMILAKLGVPAIVYVNTKDLLHQMLDNFRQYLDTEEDIFGQIGDGIVEPKLFTVALVQAVHTALDVKYPKFDDEDDTEDNTEMDTSRKAVVLKCVQDARAVVIDECQFLGSRTFQMVADNSVMAYYKYAFSATPFREDNAGIMIDAASGKKIFSISATELTKLGYLTKAKIIMTKLQKAMETSDERDMNYPQLYKAQVVENEISNDIITNLARIFYENNKLVLILVQQVSHGQILLSKLKSIIDAGDAGFVDDTAKRAKVIKDIEFLKGAVNSAKRKKVVQLFRERKVKILIATTLADQGLDIPSLDVLIKAGRGKSKVRTPQRVGRVVRIAEGKSEALVFDFFDPIRYLRKHSEARKGVYIAEPAWEYQTWDPEEISVEAYVKYLLKNAA